MLTVLSKRHLLPRGPNVVKLSKFEEWDETYLKYEFFLPDDQIPNVAPQPECLICCKRLSNSALVIAKLQDKTSLFLFVQQKKFFFSVNTVHDTFEEEY